MMKSPVTITPARDARNSTVVSFGFSSFCFSFSFFANILSPVPNSLHQPQCPVPTRNLHNMFHRIQEPVKFITGSRRADLRVSGPQRPINHQRTSHDVLLPDKAPVAAVIPIVTSV